MQASWHGSALVCSVAMRKKINEGGGRAKVAQPLPNGKSVIFTLKDMATMFRVTIRTIYNWMDDNRFSYIKIGSKTYVTEIQLKEFLANHEVKSFNVGRTSKW